MRWNGAPVRGAAPFARPEDKRKASPKRPGRKGGHKGMFRKPPPDEAVDERLEAPLTHCPGCGEMLSAQTDEVLEQTLIEVPPVKAQVIRLVTHRNWCCACQCKVASTHPLQVSTAGGAAGTHLGPRAQALAAHLNKGLGLTVRTTCRVLRDLAGITLTPGGLSQALGRMAGRVEPAYEQLLETLKAQPVLHTDETSWWVGGKSASLWVLTNPAGTFYRIVASRSSAEAEALMGDYQGVLVSDCLNIYDNLTPPAAQVLRPSPQGDRQGPRRSQDAGRRLPAKPARPAHRRHDPQVREGQPQPRSGRRHAPSSPGQAPSACWGHLERGSTPATRPPPRSRRPCACAYSNSATTSSPSSITTRSTPPTTSPNASCGRPSSAESSPAATKPTTAPETWQILASLAATCRQTKRRLRRLPDTQTSRSAPPTLEGAKTRTVAGHPKRSAGCRPKLRRSVGGLAPIWADRHPQKNGSDRLLPGLSAMLWWLTAQPAAFHTPGWPRAMAKPATETLKKALLDAGPSILKTQTFDHYDAKGKVVLGPRLQDRGQGPPGDVHNTGRALDIILCSMKPPVFLVRFDEEATIGYGLVNIFLGLQSQMKWGHHDLRPEGMEQPPAR